MNKYSQKESLCTIVTGDDLIEFIEINVHLE